VLARLLPSALVAAGLALASSPPAAAGRYQDGQPVVVTGIVTDGEGVPIPQLTVVLEASRSGFDLRRLERSKRETQRVSATSDERGEYSIEWPWSGYYNTFEIAVGVPVRKGSDEKLEILQRLDITRRVLHGSPVVAALTIEDTSFLATLRAFLGGLRSDEERRVYAAMGKPDQVETVAYPDYREISWWYFESGKVYRFRDGELVAVVPFDPVERF
jgi:hypothetical protein